MTKVGEVYYDVTARDQTSAGLQAAYANARRITAQIEALEAEIEVGADTSELTRELAAVQAMKKAMEAEKIELEVSADVDDVEDKIQQLDHGIKEATKSAKILEQQRLVRRDQEKQLTSLHRELGKTVSEINKADKSFRQYARSQGEAITMDRKRTVTVARLREQYAKLYTELQKAQRLDRGVRDTPREVIRMQRIQAELDETAARLADFGEDTRGLDVDLNRSSNTFGKWAHTILSTRIHLGFFSTTLGALGPIIIGLGPIIASVAGALGALIGVLGAGIAGAAAVGIAGMMGFGLAAFGIIAAVQSMPKVADAAEKGWDQLGTRFSSLTKELEKPALDTLNESFRTANALMPIFAAETVKTGRVVGAEAREMFQSLRGDEARGILADVMGNFRKSIPGIAEGLSSIGAAFGRIGQSASKLLPSLTGGFAKWANNLERSIGSGDELDQKVNRLGGHMRQLGHFTQAGGSALLTFFGIGAGPGGNALDAMTRSLNRWNAAMKEDPSGTRNFFENSIDLMKQLGPAVFRTLQTMGNLATAFTPALTAAATVLNLIATAASKIPGPILAAAGALAILTKVANAVALTGILGAGIAGAAGAKGGLAGGLITRIFGTPAASAAAGAAAGGAASFVAEGMGEAAEASTAARGATVGAAGGISFLGAAAAGAGVYLGALGLMMVGTKEHVSDLERATREYPEAAARAGAATRAWKNAQESAAKAHRDLNEVIKAGKINTQQGATALDRSIAAGQRQRRTYREQQDATRRYRDSQADLREALRDAQQSVDDLADSEDRRNVAGGKGGASAVQTQTRSEEAHADALRRVRAAQAALTLGTVNYRRELNGLPQVAGKTADALAKIQRAAGKKAAVKIGLEGSDKAIQETARLTGRIKQLGAGSKAVKIVANSESAQQAIVRLQRLLNNLKAKSVNITARDLASPKVQRLAGQIQRLRDKQIAIRESGAAGSASRVAALQAQINNLRDKMVNVRVHTTYTSSRSGGASPGGAPGGVGNEPGYAGGRFAAYAGGGITQDRLDKAAERATNFATVRAGPGRRVTRPTFLAGELMDDTEWVITDNPAFRRSNTRFLAEAAESLDFALIPAFAAGVPGKKKRKKLKKRLKGAGPTDPKYAGKTFDEWEAEQEFWATEYDLDRRSYDSKIGTGGIMPGFSLSHLLQDLGAQISAYEAMRVLLPKISNLTKFPEFETQTKKGKTNKQAAKLLKRVQAHNEAVDDTKSDADQYSDRGLRQMIQALRLEQLEIQNAASQNLILGTKAANQARYDAFTQFAGNIAPSVNRFGAWGGLAMPGLTPPREAYSSPGGFPSGSVGPNSGRTGGGDVIVNNTFATVPPDPHTWSQQVSFELSAL